MTKKDFEVIAEVLRNTKPSILVPVTSSALWKDIVNDFCFVLAAKYPRFKKGKFEEACNARG